MTQVVSYICNACNARFGPMGFHGYIPKSKTGELPGVCGTCKEIVVLRVKDGHIINEKCPQCENPRILFDGTCPICNSDKIVFFDVQMPGFEQKAEKVAL